ncbi:uncharacterized protein LOC132723602 [Ruditapes philippinarum]|uniref:uncharacterized protein LOC132723602 n=1 Tax=Ruditapes philippinarum TaxID=129788 RepID=UPI00295BB05D|nr:uncharacterized protein LOC132723602 [Ruditapes philippinarum]
MKTDTNIKMLRIFYKLSLIFFVISSTVITPGNGDDGLRKCGILKLDKPTILGRNVTFSFTPDMYDPNAILEWQRRTYVRDQWQTLPFNNKFTQYEKNMTYHLIITYSEESDEKKLYRVHYYNETIHCFKDVGTLRLEDNLCGVVNLRSEKVVENGTVEIEYYPSTNVMRNSGSFKREWRHTFGRASQILKLTDGNYQETFDEENNKYVLTIYMFNISMNGEYYVDCGGSGALYTKHITVYFPGLCVFIILHVISIKQIETKLSDQNHQCMTKV